MVRIVRSQVLALKELGYGRKCLGIDDLHEREMAFRTKDLRLVDKTMAQQIASVVGGRLVDVAIDSATDWAVMMEPLKDLKIYFVLQRYSPEFEDKVLTLYGRETVNIGIPLDDLYDFTRLCANAMVRVARDLQKTT